MGLDGSGWPCSDGDVVRVATAVVATAVLLSACSGAGGLCPQLEGADFRSAEQISAIMGPEGIEPSSEYLEFADDQAYWTYSDVVESGEWSCRDNRVSGFDGRLAADLIEEEGALVLIWGGNRFVLDS